MSFYELLSALWVDKLQFTRHCPHFDSCLDPAAMATSPHTMTTFFCPQGGHRS